MDQNTDLLLSRIAQPARWEDEEKATNDVEQLRAEFRRRLYPEAETATAERKGGASAK
jgi:hypothetical protein